MCNSRSFVVPVDHQRVSYTVETKLYIEISMEVIRKDTTIKTGRSDIWRCFMTSPEQSENSCVAVKSITFRNPTPSANEVEKAKTTIFHRASTWIELCHDNILRLEGVISDGFGLLPALVSPWMENGSLDDYLNVRQLDLDKKLFMLREIAAGLQYLHSKDIYSDLTPADILIDGDGKPCLRGFSTWMVIADSGATTFQSECQERHRWMAPERLHIKGEDQPTKTAEVYSYGCIMIMLFSGDKPYHSIPNAKIIAARFKGREPFSKITGFEEDLKKWAQKCLSNSSERPSASDIAELFKSRSNISKTMMDLLSKLGVNQIPKAALSICASDDRGSISGTLKYNWLHGSDATVVAVKTLDVGDLNDIDIDKTCDMIRREVYVRERLKHETILNLYGMTTGFGILPSFVYPWMVHGSLHDYLKRDFSTLYPLQKFGILYQVADGIRYLHENDIVHCNLTGDNVLLDDAGRIRIADFSRSVILDDAGDRDLSEQLPGAARYVSPESVVRDKQTGPPQPTKSQDVYSYGCIMILVLTGKVPYWWIPEESEVLLEKVKGTEPFLPPVEIDQVHLDLVRRCLSMSIESRPSIEKVLYSVLVQHVGVPDLTSSVQRPNKNYQAFGGFGGFTYVHRCIIHPSMSNLVYVAVKEMVLRNDWAKSQWFRTIKIWMRLKHENIVPLLGVTDGFGSVPALVLPWLGNGALTGYLQRKHEMLSYSQKFAMLSDVARGLQYLHSESIVHGDLTGNNVLVDTNGKALLTDFSLFASLPDRISQALLPTNPGGTVCYMAPECLTVDDEGDQTSVLSPASDVYSFGGIMLQVVEGNVPYYYIRTQAAIINYIARGIHPRRPPTSVISDADWDFIQMCWLGDMNRRPTTKDIVAFVEGRAEVQS